MKRGWFKRIGGWCAADFLSPKDFVRHAILIVLAFAVVHVAGLREYTSFLNGTVGSVDMDPQTAALLGLIYLLLYMAAVLLAPILIIAAAISAAWRKIKR
jgi:hypothetical protein